MIAKKHNIDVENMGFGNTSMGDISLNQEGCDEYRMLNVHDEITTTSNPAGLSKTDGGFPITQKLTVTNYTGNSNKVNKYIVIHYVGATGTAANNASYFYNTYRGASAHYFVDPNSIYQIVLDKDTSWHCGGGMQSNSGGSFYKKCRNSNSIGIEMCMKYDSHGKAYFESKTVDNTIDLTKTLMRIHGIPVDRVIRHYDVVGKYCPGPYVDDVGAWLEFKDRLTQIIKPHWAEEYYNQFVNMGIISNPEIWKDYDGYLTKAECVALLDKFTGGMWTSNEQNSAIHWAQPHVISLSGKGYIKDVVDWITTLSSYCSKALILALLDNMTGGVLPQYANMGVDHWARRDLNSLCDKGIITTPHSWDDDFEAPVTRGMFMAILIKTRDSGLIR